MTTQLMAVAGCLVAVAGLLCWPTTGRRPGRRLSATVGRTRAGRPGGRTLPRPGVAGRAARSAGTLTGGVGTAVVRADGTAHPRDPDGSGDGVTTDGRSRRAARWPGGALLAATVARPRSSMAGAAAGAGLAGVALSGPIAGLVAAVYTGLGVRGLLRRADARVRAEVHARAVDGLCALAADLRAGLPPAGRVPDVRGRLGELTTAVWRLAEATGAPVADLVERIEADARAADRSRAAAAAQAAGARATAWLLAALPLGGIALGYGIGADPLQVLLHSPIGAGCTVGALLLQLAGIAWADRLAGGPAGSAR